MNKLISFIIPFSLVCCVPSAIRPDDIDLERDRRWRNCSFYVVDHNCGLYSDPETLITDMSYMMEALKKPTLLYSGFVKGEYTSNV